MAYNNNPTNSGKKLVSTIGTSYYGKGPSGDKALNVRYMDQNLVMSIHSPLPSASQSSSSKYDYKTGVDIYMRGKTARQVAKMIRKAIEEHYAGDSISSRAIDSGSSLIEICNGTKFGLETGVAIAIYNEINADKTSKTFDVFAFNDDQLILNYDHSNGSYEAQGGVDTDIEYLVDQLLEFSKASTNAQAHMNKREFSFDLNKIVSRQLQICTQLGVKVESPQYNNSNNRSSLPAWNNGGNSAANARVSVEDIMNELDD